MRGTLIALLFGLTCGAVGFCAGILYSPQLRATDAGRWLKSIESKVAGTASRAGSDAAYETYDYPTIKWRPKPLSDVPGGIAQLWTTYEWADEKHQSGTMNYRLTVFKGRDKNSIEVQLLDDKGFKITQFNASDFHQIPGSTDLMEARDSHECTEERYKRVGDYSVK